MDVDLDTSDFENDPVKEFINFKLEEIKIRNEDLLNQLEKKKRLLTECTDKTYCDTNSNLVIRKVWKSIIQNKLIIGFNCVNNSKCIEDINVILKQDDAGCIKYSVKTFAPHTSANLNSLNTCRPEINDALKILEENPEINLNNFESEFVESLHDFCEITVTMDVPDFYDKQTYIFDGIVLLKMNKTETLVPIPKFEVSVKDMYSSEINISEYDILNYKQESILSFLSINPKIELIFYIEQTAANRILDNLLLTCMKRVRNAKSMYLASNSHSRTIGPLIKVSTCYREEMYLVHIYYQERSDFVVLLHFLFENIPKLKIIPKNIDTNCFKNIEESILLNLLNKNEEKCKTVIQKLGELLESEIKLIETILVDKIKGSEDNDPEIITFSVDKEKYFKLREDLVNVEDRTELIFAIANNIFQNKSN